MLTWNKFFRMSASALAVLILAGLWASNIFAQGQVYRYTTTSYTASSYTSISSTGNVIGLGDDNLYSFTGPPFAFNYDSINNAANATMYICTNGYVGWSDPYVDCYDNSVGNLSTSTGCPNCILPFATDLVVSGTVYGNGSAGDMYYQTIGSAPNREFIIEWYNWEAYNNGTYTSMQVHLYETLNIIEIVYLNHSDNVGIPGDATGGGTGLNGRSTVSTDYLQFGSSNSQSSTPSSDVRFTPPQNAPPPELSLLPNPKTLNFGTATPNTPDTMYATIKSVGAAGTKLGISGIALSGSSAYSIIPGGAKIGDSILVGGSELVGIQFEPFTTGTLTATLTVATSGRDSGTQSMGLTGIGAVPNVSYSATQMFRGVAIELTDTSAIQYLYVNSTGVGPLLVESVNFIGLNANNYIITHKPSVIAPGGVDSIGVRFIPTIEGLPDARLVINSSGVNDPWDTVLMFGVGILPHLQVSSTNAISTPPNPLKVSFDSVNLGADSCLNITVSNPGSDTLAVEKNFFANADVDFSYTPLTGKDTLIPPGGSQTIQVCFDPVQQGFRTATLRLVTNIPHEETASGLDTNTYDIVIIGTGVPNVRGAIRGSGPSGHIVIMVGTTGCWTDTIRNIGGGPAKVDSITIDEGNNVFPFTGSYPSFPVIIPPDSFMTFTVCASPTDTGIFINPNNLNWQSVGIRIRSSIDSSDPNFPLLFVYGTEIGDTAVVEQPFSSGCGPDTETVVVLNTENVPESYSAAIAGGSNPGDFTVLAPTTSQVESAGGSATFHVVFTPSTTSAETANLNISGGIPQTVALSAKGGAATIAGSDPAPMTAIGSTSGQFTVTVNNTGSCPWTTGVPTVDPQFSYVSGATTIAPNGSAPFVFTYSPTVAGGTSYPVSFPSSVGLSTSVNVSITTATDGVAMVSASNGYSLGQTYPNPFNDESNLEITVAAPGLVQLSVVDVQGNVVEQVLNRQFDAGTYSVTLSAEGLASGTYYYQMSAGGVTLTRQMVIVK